MSRFPSRRIVITGAASGLGRAIALRYAREGWRVAIADLHEARMAETLTLVEQAGGSGFTQCCDVRSADDFSALAARVQERWGGLDILVNNAGIATAGTTVDSSYVDWQAVLDINLLGVLRGCKTFVPMLLAQHSGHVINIASFAGIATPPGMASYNVAKAGVIALSESLRAETLDEGVDVSVACPSFFQTNLVESFRGGAAARQFTQAVMARSAVTADEVANDLYQAVCDRQFMVISHPEAREQWLLKRKDPEQLYRLVRERMKGRLSDSPK